MANEIVKLKRGTKASMPTTKEAGSILIATDTGEAYVDDSSTSRVQLKDSTKLPLSGGTMTGAIAMGSNKITGLADATEDSDAVNRSTAKDVAWREGCTAFSNLSITSTTLDAIRTDYTFEWSQDDHSMNYDATIAHLQKLSTGTAETTYGPTSATSPGYGGTFAVPNVTADKYGHLTKVGSVNITMPSAQSFSVSSGNTAITASGTKVTHATHTAQTGGPTGDVTLAHGGAFNVPYITSNQYGHVTAITNRTITLPSAPSSVATLSTSRAIDGVNFNGSAAITHYGTCSTAAATATKTVALTSFTLVTGARVCVKFTVTNTASSPTLNVNSTGAKSIYYRGAAITAGYLAANRVYEFVYDGSYYQLVGDIDTNTTYSNMSGASTSAAGKAGLVPAPSAGAATRYLRSDGTWSVPPNTNTTYSAGSGLSLSGTTINHSSSMTASTYYPTSTGAVEVGQEYKRYGFSYNATGHMTGSYSATFGVKNNITVTVADSSVQMRNIVVLPAGTDPTTVTCPVGTIICVKES